MRPEKSKKIKKNKTKCFTRSHLKKHFKILKYFTFLKKTSSISNKVACILKSLTFYVRKYTQFKIKFSKIFLPLKEHNRKF